MKRTLIALLCCAGLLAGACGDGGDDGASGGNGGGGGGGDASACPVGAFEDAAEPARVVVWSSYVGKPAQTLEKLAAEYNAQQPKVVVEVQAVANSYTELLRKFQAAIPTDDLPAITIGEDTEIRYMADSGKVLAAADCIEADDEAKETYDDVLPAVKAAYSVDGRLQPAMMSVSTIVLYYNKDHFRQAGLDPEKPPTTLAEVMEYSKQLKAAGVAKQPFVMKQDPWFLEQWVSGAGETWVNEENGRSGELATAGTLESDAAKEALGWLAEMKQQDLLNAVPGTEGQINHFLAAATQTSSMLIETSAAITTINGVLTGTFDPADLGVQDSRYDSFKNIQLSIDLGVAPNPGLEEPGKGQVGGGAWFITNTTPDEVQAGAWDFIKFMTQPETQATWTQEGGYLPILESVVDQPAIKEDWATSNRGKWLATAYEGIKSLDPEFPGPLIGPYDKFRDAVRKAVETVTLSGGDPAEALAEAQKTVTAELRSYAENNF